MPRCFLFPYWEDFIPKVGIFCSQGGNNFCAGGLSANNPRLLLNKVPLLLEKGMLLNGRGMLLRNKYCLMKKRIFLQDLTWLFEEVPVYGRFRRF